MWGVEQQRVFCDVMNWSIYVLYVYILLILISISIYCVWSARCRRVADVRSNERWELFLWFLLFVYTHIHCFDLCWSCCDLILCLIMNLSILSAIFVVLSVSVGVWAVRVVLIATRAYIIVCYHSIARLLMWNHDYWYIVVLFAVILYWEWSIHWFWQYFMLECFSSRTRRCEWSSITRKRQACLLELCRLLYVTYCDVLDVFVLYCKLLFRILAPSHGMYLWLSRYFSIGVSLR
jgi:hypothetical protein